VSDSTEQAGDHRPSLVSIQDVGKRYVKYEDTPILLSSVLRMRSKTRRSKLWAVRGVNLEVAAGETVGVIGRNGSGKSTLLRMLAGVSAPSEGTLEVRGRVAPLISVGVGFHQELTGRENVYVNGTVLGLTRKQITERYDEIVEFAEIADFMDTPVKFYSSGMFVRLGFAVAVLAEPDVLLVDEVLAVGDIGFQVKCFVRMRELQDAGSTILVVSHNLGAVRNLCRRVLVLHDGTPRFLGPTDEAISIYHELVAQSRTTEHDLQGKAPVEFSEFALLGKDGARTSHIEGNDDVSFRVRVTLRVPIQNPAFSLTISTEAGMPVYSDNDWQATEERVRYEAGEEIVCDIRLPARLTTGSYTAVAGVFWDGDVEKQLSTRPLVFYVSGRGMARGIVDLGASFAVGRPSDAPRSTLS
jgi:ABC-type polysaccharide/polyol phosphate transport system ATPase subunit